MRFVRNKLLIICCMLMAGNAYAYTLYVDKDNVHGGTCSDSRTYAQAQSWTTPWCTINKAAGTANAGDLVIVANGTYTDTNSDGRIVSVTKSGAANNIITFKAENKWGAVLSGENFTTEYCWLHSTNVNYIKIQDFEMSTCVKAMQSNNANHDISVVGNYIHNIGNVEAGDTNGRSAIFAGVGTYNFTIDSNVFHTIGRLNPYTTPTATEASCTVAGTLHCYQHDHGVYIRGATSTITNNIFYDHKSGWGIQTAPETTTLKIINNTFYGANPKRDGQIMLWGSGATIENNIFASPSNYAIVCLSEEATVYKNNLSSVGSIKLSGSDSCASGSFTTANNIINDDPLFVNAGTYDFHLQAGSPAIDQGLATYAPTYDYDSVLRADPPEIGAFEYGVTADTTAPTVPADVLAAHTGQTSISISWTASTDAVGVVGYNIYKGGVLHYHGATASPYNSSGLTAGTEYCYTVSAYDEAGNESAQSTQSCDTTDAAAGGNTYTANYSSSAITIDGSCAEADWGTASSVTMVHSTYTMTVKMLWNFTQLIYCVTLDNPSITASCARDGACSADSAFEQWFNPSGTRLVNFVHSANGNKYDYDDTSDSAYDIPSRIRTGSSAGVTTFEGAIPLLSIFTATPHQGDTFGCLFSYDDGTTQNYGQYPWPASATNYADKTQYGTCTLGTVTKNHMRLN